MLQNLFAGFPWLWLIVVVILAQILGVLWYGPLFGKLYMKENKVTEDDVKSSNSGSMLSSMTQEVISALIMFGSLALIIDLNPNTDRWLIGILYFLGIFALQRSNVIRSVDKTWKSIALICGRLLICFIVGLLLYNMF